MSSAVVQQQRPEDDEVVGGVARSDGRARRDEPGSLTIGMPVYNGGRLLSETLESLLSQTFTDFKLVISDNCSTDDTESICRAYAEADSRIRYRRQATNVGVFRNYDAVFDGTTSEYFKWASSNDLCRPRFIERCIDVLEANPDATMACTRTVLFDSAAGGEEIYEETLDWGLTDPVERYQNFWANIGLNNMMNGVIRTRFLRRTMMNRVYQGSDLNMIAELLLQGPAEFVDEPLFWRRMSPEASSAAKSKAHHDSFFEHEPVQAVRGQLAKQLMFAVVGAMKAPSDLRTKRRATVAALRRLVRNRRKLTREVIELWRGDALEKVSR